MTYNLNVDLKPCPFCGESPNERFTTTYSRSNNYIQYEIYCYPCNIDRHDSVESGCNSEKLLGLMDKVQKMWNTRVERGNNYVGDNHANP